MNSQKTGSRYFARDKIQSQIKAMAKVQPNNLSPCCHLSPHAQTRIEQNVSEGQDEIMRRPEEHRDRSTQSCSKLWTGGEEMMLGNGKSSMDLVLVPCALAAIVGYHLLLLYRILQRPHTTAMGYENHNKLAWVQRMARTAAPEEAALALTVISDGISASTTLASLCIALASLIGAWVTSGAPTSAGGDGGASEAAAAAAAAKYAWLLACFLASFTCFVQSAGWYVHASFLISALGSDAPASHLRRAVLRGGGFWTAGLRALYLATALLVWVVFGPAAMLACSVLTVAVLYLLDGNSVPAPVLDDGGADRVLPVDELRSLSCSQSSSMM